MAPSVREAATKVGMAAHCDGLWAEGWRVNNKQVHRLWRAEDYKFRRAKSRLGSTHDRATARRRRRVTGS